MESFKSRLDHAEERISYLEDKIFTIIQRRKKKEKWIKKSEESLWHLWDIIKRNNVHIMEIQGKRKRKRIEIMFKAIMAKNFPNVGTEIDIQIQEAQRTLNMVNLNRITSWYIMNSLSKVKDKERIFKAARQKRELHARKCIRLSVNFPAKFFSGQKRMG